MKTEKVIQKHWDIEGVKYNTKPLSWNKQYLRSADCHLCKRHETEKRPGQTFLGWAVLPIGVSISGKYPEVCPDCLTKINNKLTVKIPRIIRCFKCGETQKEKIFGVGHPGWVSMQSVQILGNRTATFICPDCYLEMAKTLGPDYLRGTWTDITYAANSLLTSTKMTQNQANFTALAEGHAGAPEIIGDSLSDPFEIPGDVNILGTLIANFGWETYHAQGGDIDVLVNALVSWMEVGDIKKCFGGCNFGAGGFYVSMSQIERRPDSVGYQIIRTYGILDNGNVFQGDISNIGGQAGNYSITVFK